MVTARERFVILLANEQTAHFVDEAQLIAGARAVLDDSPFSSAEISLAVVDDRSMHDLNRQFLEHDYPTDVLSFALDETDGRLQGEVIISADTAATKAEEIGWPATAEQLLYVVHGMLHLIGFRDKGATEAAEMRKAELRYLGRFGYEQPSQAGDR